jgi:hypothetical protein
MIPPFARPISDYPSCLAMKIFPPLLAALGLVSCNPAEAPRQWTDAEATGRAKAAAQEAFAGLSTELGKAMAEGGPTNAIPVCSSKAGSLTAAVAANHGVRMVRLSHRPRNPDQRAEGDDLDALLAMQTERKPRVEHREDGTAIVRLPIALSNPICLQCHGGPDDIAPETRKTLAKLYPEDEATGFSLNELRGIWRIEVPPPAKK